MIVSIVNKIVNQLDVNGVKFGFILGDEFQANIEADEFDFGDNQALVVLDQPITNDYQLTAGGYIGEFYPVFLYFMFKSEMDWTPLEHDVAVEKANDAIRQFLSICQSRNDLIDEIADANGLEFHNLLDVNGSGKSLNVNIKPRINKSVCVPPIPANE